jgi:hypothetical protein
MKYGCEKREREKKIKTCLERVVPDLIHNFLINYKL